MTFSRKRIQTRTGNWVKGKYYLRREDELTKLWGKITRGEHMLLSAPRRVGKTSILMDLAENPLDGYIAIYEITESINEKNKFFKRVYDTLVQELDNKGRLTAAVKNLFKRKGIKVAGVNGIEFEKHEPDYHKEIIELCEKLPEEHKYIMMVDEFAQTIQNVLEDRGEVDAREFLSLNRELRQNPAVSEKLQFVYAGSIGLENVVGNINLTKTINDINPFVLRQFDKSEARELVDQILDGTDLSMDDAVLTHLLEKVGLIIPFYIQLILEGCDELLPMESEEQIIITNDLINESFNLSLYKRNYFEDWYSRLRRTFKGADYNFIVEVLNICANEGSVGKNKVLDLSFQFEVNEAYRNLIRTLEHDGYIVFDKELKKYSFHSALLKEWWKDNID